MKYNSLKEAAKKMPPIKKQLVFKDRNGVEGCASVMAPGEVFNFRVKRVVAENLLTKHKDALPFDILRPLDESNLDGDWVEVTTADLQDRLEPYAGCQEKCSLHPWTIFELQGK